MKKSESNYLVLVRPWWEYKYDVYSGDEIVPELFERENLENVFRTEFCCSITNEEFSKRKMLKVVRDVLVDLKDTVFKLGLLPKIEEEVEEETQEE